MKKNRNFLFGGNRGFTLVELLGVIVILSIIMVIAIPNVISVFENNKRETYLSDAQKLVTQAKYQLRSGNISKPGSNEALKITLHYLGTSDVSKDSDGNHYNLDKSYVVVVRKDETLKYYVNLVADLEDGSTKGIKLTDSDELSGDDRLKLVEIKSWDGNIDNNGILSIVGLAGGRVIEP